MKVALIARATLFKVQGGITVQVVETAKHLREIGVEAEVRLANEKIDYTQYDILHFFDLIRPANIISHLKKSKQPYVVTPILIDYSEYDKKFRKGLSGLVFKIFSTDANEYIKTVVRWLLRKDKLPAKKYLWMGQKKSARFILENCAMVLPNSQQEYKVLSEKYRLDKPYAIIPNGINEKIFSFSNAEKKTENLVLCVARIEGIKNQLNLIKALNGSGYHVLLIGEAGQNQKSYFDKCRELAAENIEFLGKLSQVELVDFYKAAKVHVLPSWFETCGLSSLEAAAMGCNIVITEKGYASDYFSNDGFYCEPGDITSIRAAVEKASSSPVKSELKEKIFKQYTWSKAAKATMEAYQTCLNKRRND